MNKNEFNFKKKMIKETFNENRKIICPTPKSITRLADNVYPGGDIFTTENGEFIDFELQLEDFDEAELTKYIEFAENLYEKHHKHVSVYLLCTKNVNVTVKECKIYSESDFTIKLACSQEDPLEMILSSIKKKIRNGEFLDEEDLHLLEKLPVWCDKKDRNYYRMEYLKIINGHYC